ncbi:sensor histidine kinase [Halopenitus salinus]|uniref:Sensor histidine kinase n=1 Tax=Halopenitus salinus TaxID=1198295 RepID=A0ABD5UPY7_9EURY
MSQEELIVDEGSTTFTSDSQILSELGERLIATEQVALAELIKNAYDADATRCNIWLEDDGNTLIVDDDGHGMTEREFDDFWMTIATSNRGENPTSKRYNREVQGSKGVGRFAVRNLGLYLELDTVAKDPESGEYLRLTADFDWKEFESGAGLREMEVEYQISRDARPEEEGTRLRISELRDEWSAESLEDVSSEVLDIVSAPYEPDPAAIEGTDDEDPGFSVYFAPPGEGSPAKSIAREIYERYVAKVDIATEGNTLIYRYEYEDADEREYQYDLAEEGKYGENLVGELNGEIRFIPNRKGVLAGMETFDGRDARSWLTENGGVRVIDGNFRMPPYGDKGNDWLGLSESQARRSRNWASSITESLFPEGEREVTENDAMLMLPRKIQVLGAVHVTTYRPGERVGAVPDDRLVPGMNRQGFVENEAYDQLVDIVRGSLEILGIIDVLEQRKQEQEEKEEKVEETTEDAKASVSSAKSYVKDSDDISGETETNLLDQLDEAEKNIEEKQEAEQEAREAVESMNVLGVFSAFMSHETSLIVDSAEQMIDRWEDVPEEQRSQSFQEAIQTTEQALEDFRAYQSYAQMVMNQLESQELSSFKSYAQVAQLIDTFKNYTESRHIEPINDISRDIKTPELNVGMYTGVLANLYSNAMKAVVETPVSDGGRKIRFEAENTEEWHKVRVIDNGPGISEEEQTRMFEPWYSTSEVEGPMGVGHGLGLYIVRKVVNEIDGGVSLVDAPDGYETAFEVRFPR